MKKIYLLSILCMLAFGATAQQKEYKGKMSITPLQLEQVGDSLRVSIDFDIQGVNVDSRRSISLIPVLIGRSEAKKLPAVMVKGRANYLTSKREVALMNKSEYELYKSFSPDFPYAIVKGYKNNGQKSLLYKRTIPFESWMKDARLDIQEDLCGCGNAPRSLAVSQLVNAVKLEEIIAPYTVMPHLAYVQPEVEAVKSRAVVGEAFIDFASGKTDIRYDYKTNWQELKKITDMMEEVRKDPSITVRGISVEGYASPEGSLKLNETLSEGRAKALVNYLAPKFNYSKHMYHVSFGGENWDGLLAMVEQSDMRYRDEVIHIIQYVPAEINYQTNTSRKSSLMSLRGGEPYKYMLKEYFPSLRKAICKVDYEVKGFNLEEAKEVFETRPQNLSLNEMYLVANTYEAGSDKFNDVFETAVRMFPDDETANLNAAQVALSRGDTVLAEKYLAKIKSRVRVPQYDNAMGVLAMLKGNYATAEDIFKSAQKVGVAAATENLKELELKRENEKQIDLQSKSDR